MSVEGMVVEKVRTLPEGKLRLVLSFLEQLEKDGAEGERSQRRPRARLGAGAAARGWIAEHRAEYTGQWVAMDADRLVANGSNAKQVYEEALRQGVAVPFLGFVKARPDGPLWGGWL